MKAIKRSLTIEETGIQEESFQELRLSLLSNPIFFFFFFSCYQNRNVLSNVEPKTRLYEIFVICINGISVSLSHLYDQVYISRRPRFTLVFLFCKENTSSLISLTNEDGHSS